MQIATPAFFHNPDTRAVISIIAKAALVEYADVMLGARKNDVPVPLSRKERLLELCAMLALVGFALSTLAA